MPGGMGTRREVEGVAALQVVQQVEGVAADDEDEVGVVQVFERDGAGAGGARQ